MPPWNPYADRVTALKIYARKLNDGSMPESSALDAIWREAECIHNVLPSVLGDLVRAFTRYGGAAYEDGDSLQAIRYAIARRIAKVILSDGELPC